MKEKRSCIVISASSDIGYALCRNWSENGMQVFGTYRNESLKTKELQKANKIELVKCDLLDKDSIKTACSELKEKCSSWDVLLFAAGALEPMGLFENVDFKAWEEGIKINFLNCMNVLHLLLPFRNKKHEIKPKVLFFAGGGTNNAPKEYSSYTLSKIALIKSCELLDAEIPDTTFSIVGPGWVNTKIHDIILAKKEGEAYERTKKHFRENDFISMEQVISCFDWLINTKSTGISGRNISISSDKYGTKSLEKALEEDENMYKLRRHKNYWEN